MKTIKKILYFLSATEKKKAILLFGMVLVMALLDMLGIASIMPFIAVLGNPDLIETNNVLNSIYMLTGDYGIKTHVQFLFVLGILVFILLVVSLAFKGLTTYAQLRFTLMREYSIGKRMIEGHLHQPYSWFLSRHS
jgi:ABC-type multidrug transport system fused ATPase/permease subunit